MRAISSFSTFQNPTQELGKPRQPVSAASHHPKTKLMLPQVTTKPVPNVLKTDSYRHGNCHTKRWYEAGPARTSKRSIRLFGLSTARSAANIAANCDLSKPALYRRLGQQFLTFNDLLDFWQCVRSVSRRVFVFGRFA